MRYGTSPLALVDLFVLVPFFLPFLAFDLRAVRLLRVLLVFKFARYSESLRFITSVFNAKRDELTIVVLVEMLVLILFSSLI